MNTHTITILLRIAAMLHVFLICAGASMPKAVNMRAHLAVLPPFLRQLFFIYFSFIGLMLVGFGALTFIFAPAMAAGEPVARGLSMLLTAFWSLRFFAAFVFDVRPYLTNWIYRVGYYVINVIFLYLLAVYSFAALKGGGL